MVLWIFNPFSCTTGRRAAKSVILFTECHQTALFLSTYTKNKIKIYSSYVSKVANRKMAMTCLVANMEAAVTISVDMRENVPTSSVPRMFSDNSEQGVIMCKIFITETVDRVCRNFISHHQYVM